MAGRFEFDVEAALLDDVAIAWDDPDATNPLTIVVPPATQTYQWTVATQGTEFNYGYPTPFTLSDANDYNLRIVGVAPAITVGVGGGGPFTVTVNQAIETDTAQTVTRVKTVHVNERVATDDFNRTNAAGLGAAWDEEHWGVDSNEAERAAGAINDFARYLTDVGQADMFVEATYTNPTGLANASYVVVNLRADAALGNNAILGFIKPPDATTLANAGTIGMVQSGAYTELGVGVAIYRDAPFSLRLEASGTTYRLYQNNVLVCQVTSATPTGLGQYAGFNANATGVTFDNFRVGWVQVPLVETGTAQPITARKTKTLGQAGEADTAQPVLRAVTVAAPVASLTLVGVAPTVSVVAAHIVPVGQSSETDTAQPMVFASSAEISTVVEADTAQPITARKTKLIGQAGGAAIAVTLLTSEDFGATGFVSASITPGPNCALVLLTPGMADGGGAFTTPTAVSSGSGPVWTLAAQADSGTYVASGSVHTAIIGDTDPGTFTVTWTRSGSASIFSAVYALFKVTGHDLASTFLGATAQGAQNGDGPETLTLGATPGVGDAVLAACYADSDGNGGSQFDTGWIESVDFATSGIVQGSGNAGYRTDLATTTVSWSDVNVGGGGNYSSSQVAVIVNGSGVSDIAQPITARKTVLLGQASETDSAQAVTSRKTKAVGQSSETDTAQPITRVRRYTLGQASETDTAQALTLRRTYTLGQATETDTAQSMVFATTQAVAQASELDTAQPITARKTKALGQASEIDTAQPVSVNPIRRLIGQASETDTAQPISPAVVVLVLLTPVDDSEVDVTDGETFTWNAPGTQTTFAFRRRRVPSGPWEYWNGTTWQLTRAEISSATESVTFDPAEW